MFRGVDHVGIGVGDMDVALEFFGARRASRRALRLHRRAAGYRGVHDRRGPAGAGRDAGQPVGDPAGPGTIKLVQVLDGDGPPPIPEGTGWGEVGICEICLHVRDLEAVHERLRRCRAAAR